jgi:sugar transferase (PEP-CTERM/EpsH1 system associated)
VKILWLKSELLHPVDKGGKIRTYQMLKHLKHDHEITYLALATPTDAQQSFDQATEYCHKLITVGWQERRKFSARFYLDLGLNLISSLPYALQKYRSTAMREAIEREMNQDQYDVVVCDFLAPAVNFQASGSAASVLFQHNVESMIWRRHYETETDRLKRAFFRNQWRKMRAYEQAACRRFDAVIAVSEVDRDLMRDEFGIKAVYDVPTGVDTDYFRPGGNSAGEPYNLVFTGSMDWLPNEDAIRYFSEQIMPRIKLSIPRVTLTVVGRNPHPSLIEMSKRDSSIIVTGRVEDVRPYMERAAAYIVPLRIGGGTRLKIYEAMAMEKAVVSTTIGAEGLPVRDGAELLMADAPEDFASAVVRVLNDEKMAKALGARASALVRERFGWDKASESFANICQQACLSASKMHSGLGGVSNRAMGCAHL